MNLYTQKYNTEIKKIRERRTPKFIEVPPFRPH